MSAKIPQEFINELLSKVCIVKLISSYVTLVAKGNNYSGLCPFHKEKTPSFTVNKLKQFYHCFGCAASGNAITFVMEFSNLNFPAAIAQLCPDAGMDMPQQTEQVDQDKIDEYKESVALYEKIADYYVANLQQDDKAKKYLAARGLDEQTIASYKIGVSKQSWSDISTIHADKKSQLVKLGVISNGKNNKFFDRFRDRVMFPIINEQSNIIGFGARSLGDDMPKYLNSSESHVFKKGNEIYGLYNIINNKKKINSIIVVEGYMDVICLAQHHITNAVATLGTAITKNQINKILKYTSKIAFCFDGDNAGKKAAWKALLTIAPHMYKDINIKFVFLPLGEDPDSIVLKHGKNHFATYFKKANSFADLMFEYLAKKHDCNDLSGKAMFIKECQSIINIIPQSIYRTLLEDSLAKTVNIKVGGTSNQKRIYIKKHYKEVNNLDVADKFLAIIVQNPEFYEKMLNDGVDIPKDLFIKSSQQNIFAYIIKNHKEGINTSHIIEQFRDTDEYDEISSFIRITHLVVGNDLYKELKGLLDYFSINSIKQQIDLLLQKSKQQKLDEIDKLKLQSLIAKQRKHTE
tara:strand:- start:398 stop:2125 length:1728 start_codon:yes stop_codon:yes gene_type:complete